MKKKIGLILLLGFVWFSTLLIGMKIGITGTEKRLEVLVQTTPNYTGQEIQDAVNAYRVKVGLKELKIDSDLCNNLYDRYAKMLSEDALTTGHPGFDEWADQKIKDYGYTLVGEVFSPDLTTEKVMTGWENSPGHNAAITNPKYTGVCTYAGERGVVVVMGAK